MLEVWWVGDEIPGDDGREAKRQGVEEAGRGDQGEEEVGIPGVVEEERGEEVIALLDTSHDLREAEAELGSPVEQLLTPLTRFRRQCLESKYAIDNGAFSKFDAEAFEALLGREIHDRKRCRFVAVPDIVGSARRTLEVFRYWQYKLTVWPLALVAQDGQEDLDIPWDGIVAIFIGGTTKFKMSQAAADVVKTAKAVGKWVHAGRVNTPGRFEYFEELGADSIDGTGLSRYSWMRERIYREAIQGGLWKS